MHSGQLNTHKLTVLFVHLQLRSRLPAGQCYCVVERHVRDQVSEVLKHFNVSVSVNDIFSRCQVSGVMGQETR